MRPSIGLVGLCLLLAPAVLAQDDNDRLPDLATVSQPDGDAAETTDAPQETREPPQPTATNNNDNNDEEEEKEEEPATTDDAKPTTSLEQFTVTGTTSSTTDASRTTNPADNTLPAFHLTGLPTIAGYGPVNQVVPDTSRAAYMQKSSLPEGTIFIVVGAALGFFGAAVLAWRALVAWSLHRSSKRVNTTQGMADLKGGAALPGRSKKGMYNVVGASSTMSLDHLSAAPPGKSKPFASSPNQPTPPKSNSLFFSPTAGARPDSMAGGRSSTYLPAGYYPSGAAQAASGNPLTQIGGGGNGHLSTHSLATPGNRYSARSGISPPASPSLPPSRGYDRAPPSRDGMSTYNRQSVATLGAQSGRGMYGAEGGSMSQLSLNVPGGNTTGGRAPSAYLEDLFESNAGQPGQQRY